MGDYESGYDPKYGYNKNAFAHKTFVTGILGRTVKLIAAPIGLVSEAVHQRKDKRTGSDATGPADQAKTASPSLDKTAVSPSSPPPHDRDASPPVYVHVPADQAEELLKSKQAVPADGEEPTHELVPLESPDNDDFDKDDADWALDDAATEVEGDGSVISGDNKSIRDFISSKFGGGDSAKPIQRRALPFPVVLPQRRPGTKTRGFVRAYAPVLQDADVDQEMFLAFLKDFHKAVQASPIFDVIIVGTALAGFYPDPLIGLGIQAVQVAAAAGQEIQERWRTNTFLDQANKDIFIPRGLYALVVAYVPGNSDHPQIESQTVDLGASAFVKYGGSLAPAEGVTESDNPEDKPTQLEDIKEKMKKLRIASGKTHGEPEMPVTCAPLIFPTLDAAADKGSQQGPGDLKTKSKNTSKFVQNYFDRRAQASYAYANPDSTLTSSVSANSPQFKSRFADPNNATNTHFFTLITGGKYKAEPLGARRRYEKAQRKAEQRRLQGLKEKGSKRKLQEGILYLNIVNMPTHEELEKARKEIQEAKEKKAAEKNKT